MGVRRQKWEIVKARGRRSQSPFLFSHFFLATDPFKKGEGSFRRPPDLSQRVAPRRTHRSRPLQGTLDPRNPPTFGRAPYVIPPSSAKPNTFFQLLRSGGAVPRRVYLVGTLTNALPQAHTQGKRTTQDGDGSEDWRQVGQRKPGGGGGHRANGAR
jgi:hypothetical protein